MEEKILIKSKMAVDAKEKIRALVFLFWGQGIIISLILSLPIFEYETLVSIGYGFGYWEKSTEIGWVAAFCRVNALPLVMFIVMCLSFLIGLVVFVIFLVTRKCELVVTDKNVRGKTLFGKEVVLPLYMVSAYSTRKFMSTIAVATSSGLTRFTLIGNYKEIGDVLSGLINERQAKQTANSNETFIQSDVKNASVNQGNSLDEIMKLKTLLDCGAITQEEFDAKKKQLLGL